MDYVYLGKIVNTHGIKGEVRLLSDFDKKNIVFQKNFVVYIGEEKNTEVIASYRKHKNYDMITLKGIDDINQVLKYKGKNVYINRADLKLEKEEYLLDDLLSMKIICKDKEFGVVEDIYDNQNYTLLAIKFEKNYYIPYNKRYIKSVDLQNKTIVVDSVEDLIL